MRNLKFLLFFIMFIVALSIIPWLNGRQVHANDVARRDIMRVEQVWSQLGLYGTGQIVSIADSGPGQYGSGDDQEIPNQWPNHVMGWGRIDIAASLGLAEGCEVSPDPTPPPPDGSTPAPETPDPATAEKDENDDNLIIYLFIGGSCSLVILLGVLIFVLWRQRQTQSYQPANALPYPDPGFAPAVRQEQLVAPSQARVVIQSGPLADQQFPLTRGDITIGRSSRNTISLKDPRVSRHHARIEQRADGFYLHDLGSANGTFVRGQCINSQALYNNDKIRVGDSIMIFRMG